MAVVKANAYGHGLEMVGMHLDKFGADYFGVATISEAIRLRKAGSQKPILIFGVTPASEAGLLKEYDLIQSVSSFETAKRLSEISSGLKFHLKIDTGMARYGLDLRNEERLSEALKETQAIYSLKNADVCGIYTHFAEAAKTDSFFTKQQFSLFSRLLEELEKSGIKPGLRHAANSGAALLYQEMHLDMIRSGIALYGLPPVETNHGFLPVMSLEALVVEKRILRAGETVSYGRTFKAPSDLEIATISLGYADGYPRQASNKDYFQKANQKLKVVGTVCMDALIIDVTNKMVNIGDYVEVFGKQKLATALAELTNTIDYEILTSVGNRVERVYRSR
jgi:alanine racemase